jgi:hypothetical protein
MFAWCKLLPILHFRLFLVAVLRYSYIELNRQMSLKLTSVQILKMPNKMQFLKSGQHYTKYFIFILFYNLFSNKWQVIPTEQNTRLRVTVSSTDFVLQPEIGASCKRPTLFSDFMINNVTTSRYIIYCSQFKPYFNVICKLRRNKPCPWFLAMRIGRSQKFSHGSKPYLLALGPCPG